MYKMYKTCVMCKIVDSFNNNNMFRAGFFMGTGLTLMLSGTTILLFRCYYVSKN